MNRPEFVDAIIDSISDRSAQLAGAFAVVAAITLGPVAASEAVAADDRAEPTEQPGVPGLAPTLEGSTVTANVSSLPDGVTYGLVVGGLPLGVSAEDAQEAYDRRDYAVGFDQSVLGYETNAEGDDILVAQLPVGADCRDLQADIVIDGEVVDRILEDNRIETAEALMAGEEGVVVAGVVLENESGVCEDGEPNGSVKPAESALDNLPVTGVGLLAAAVVVGGASLAAGGGVNQASRRWSRRRQ